MARCPASAGTAVRFRAFFSPSHRYPQGAAHTAPARSAGERRPLGRQRFLYKVIIMAQNVSGKQPLSENRPVGITIVAVLMILFGLAEVVTGFRHEFFGLTTAQVKISTDVGVSIGLFYFIGGL